MQNQKIITSALLSLLTLSTISAMGLLQSTERVGSTGIIVKSSEPHTILPSILSLPKPSPPEPKVELDIFTDIQCSIKMTTINWGVLEAGETSHMPIFIKNIGETKITLGLFTENWSSQQAMEHMHLSWDYDGTLIHPNQVVKGSLTLQIDQNCPELSQYGFDIIIVGS